MSDIMDAKRIEEFIRKQLRPDGCIYWGGQWMRVLEARAHWRIEAGQPSGQRRVLTIVLDNPAPVDRPDFVPKCEPAPDSTS